MDSEKSFAFMPGDRVAFECKRYEKTIKYEGTVCDPYNLDPPPGRPKIGRAHV